MAAKGTHLLVDLYGCKSQPVRALGVLTKIAKSQGFRILDKSDHRFGSMKKGETALLLLAESHASIHTWPEKGYAAFDFYSCRPLSVKQAGRMVAELVRWFGCKRYDVKKVERGRK